MAGDLEPQFVENAEQLLADAGGAGGDPAQGNARELRVISGVEHISILFKADSYAVARHWLDDTFGQQPGAVDYRDRRMSWYGLGIVGVLLLGWALTPFLDQASNTQRTPLPLWRRLFVPVGGRAWRFDPSLDTKCAGGQVGCPVGIGGRRICVDLARVGGIDQPDIARLSSLPFIDASPT